ncbi:hypothetical protein GCM10022403_054650 [Streptomyces coacervatus]|uniref:Protein kinase domain-containing protein n=1 Tax=Streptomyces coacervatus TaxID=647381 RepID=A0ABP7IB82_9ACTN|nr:serine/threonine-protein kinase [Streptomyces coacervatus]MDF2269170.1 serine/threonine-protein kinase [Streptomyces coacervatus]
MSPGEYPLPEPLADAFPAGAELIGQGGEADVFRARDADGVLRAVKLYRRGLRADRTVWERLERLRHHAIVQVAGQGSAADGRDYEVLEYLGGGALAERLHSGPLAAAQLVSLVRQLTGGVNCLHAAGIIHRDLKPANLLYRDPGSDSAVVIADFGISRDRERAHRTTSMTLAYAPPEFVLEGESSEAYDWWALGMIVREAATGTPPFAGLSEHGIRQALDRGAVPLEQVPGDRLPALCAGLLQTDPARRWRGREVLEWLDGRDTQTPPSRSARSAPTRREAEPVRPPGPSGRTGMRGLAYAGRLHTTRAGLAAALRERPGAADYFFGRMGTPQTPSEAWRELSTWLRELDDLTAVEREGRRDLFDRWLTGDLTPEVKLLRLLVWLDPEGPVVFREREVTLDGLADLCVAAYRTGGPEAGFVAALDRTVLETLRGFTRLRRLGGVELAWERAVKQWNKAVSQAVYPTERQGLDLAPPRPLLLLAVLPGRRAEERLRELGRNGMPSAREPDSWYGRLHRSCREASPRLGEVVQAHLGARAERDHQERLEAERRLAARERERRVQEEARAAVHREYADLVAAWEESEQLRLAPAEKTAASRRVMSRVLAWLALAMVGGWVAWGIYYGDGRIATWLSWETGIIGLFMLMVGSTSGDLGSAYRPFLLAVKLGCERPSLAKVVLGALWRTAYIGGYIWLAGAIWHDTLGSMKAAEYFSAVIGWVFALGLGVIVMWLSVMTLGAHEADSSDPAYERRKQEYEAQKASLEESHPELRPAPQAAPRARTVKRR